MESSAGIENCISDLRSIDRVAFESNDDRESSLKPASLAKALLLSKEILNLDETESSNNFSFTKKQDLSSTKILNEEDAKDEKLILIKGLKNDSPLLSDKLSIQSTDSSSIPKQTERVQVSETWDNLDLYFKILESKKLKESKKGGKKPTSLPLKIIQFITNLKKGDPFSFISDTAVLKVFLVSSLMLFLQLKYSKKARVWLFYTLNIILYLLGLTLSAGTLTLLALKIKSNTKKSQKKKSLENENSQPKPSEQPENVSNAIEPSSEVKQI